MPFLYKITIKHKNNKIHRNWSFNARKYSFLSNLTIVFPTIYAPLANGSKTVICFKTFGNNAGGKTDPPKTISILE